MRKAHLDAFCGRLLRDDVSAKVFYDLNSQSPICISYWLDNAEDEQVTNYIIMIKVMKFNLISSKSAQLLEGELHK